MNENNLTRTLSVLGPYLWPRGRNDLRWRVVIALGSLALAKLANVYVPLLLGDTIDGLSSLESAPNLAFGIPLAIILAYGFARWSSTAFGELRRCALLSGFTERGPPGCSQCFPTLALAVPSISFGTQNWGP